MKNIVIDHLLKEKVPTYCCAALSFEMNIAGSSSELKAEMAKLATHIAESLTLETLLKEPRIHAARTGYKALGKDPSRYRLATESLLRRLIKGNGLYHVSNAVDIGNVLSIKTQRSVAVLDEQQIQGDVLIRIGQDEPYEGIGRGTINVENIPVYCDAIGPFGSPTSDTIRTAIKSDTKQILLFIMSFDGTDGLLEDVGLAKKLFRDFASVDHFDWKMVE